jgi:hypothetical protein
MRSLLFLLVFMFGLRMLNAQINKGSSIINIDGIFTYSYSSDKMTSIIQSGYKIEPTYEYSFNQNISFGLGINYAINSTLITNNYTRDQSKYGASLFFKRYFTISPKVLLYLMPQISINSGSYKYVSATSSFTDAYDFSHNSFSINCGASYFIKPSIALNLKVNAFQFANVSGPNFSYKSFDFFSLANPEILMFGIKFLLNKPTETRK